MSVRKSLAWSYGANALAFVVTFIATIILTRLLTPHELGIFAIGAAIVGVLTTISSFGIAPYIVRAKEVSRDTMSATFTVNGLLNAILVVTIWIIAAAERWLLSAPEIGRVLAFLAFTPLLSTFEFLPAALLMRESRFAAISHITLARALVNSVAVVILAWRGWSYLSPAIAAVVAGGSSLLFYNVAGWRYASLRLSLSGWRNILVFGVQMMSVGGVATLSVRLSELVLSRTLGVSALGIYTRASGLAAMVWDGAYGLATRIVFVELANEQRQQGTLSRTFLSATQLITAILWPAMLGIAILSKPLIQLLYGPRWQDAALPLSFLMIAQFIGVGFALNWELCVLTNRTGWQARTEILRALIGISAFSLGALFSLAGAAVGRIADAVIGYVIYRPKMTEMSGAAAESVTAIYRSSALLTVVATLPSFILMVATSWSPNTPILAVGVAVLVGVILWSIALYITDHPIIREIEILSRWRPKS